MSVGSKVTNGEVLITGNISQIEIAMERAKRREAKILTVRERRGAGCEYQRKYSEMRNMEDIGPGRRGEADRGEGARSISGQPGRRLVGSGACRGR